ncbi:hypothetical protein BH09PSE6_BH09PSE6_17810 [soil metagenome]
MGDLNFLRSGGVMGQLMAEHDWSDSPLGAPSTWPVSLRALVSFMLAARQPMYLALGPDHRMLYNDSYIPICGPRHPAALGAPLYEVWNGLATRAHASIKATLAGEGQWFEDLPLHVVVPDYEQVRWFSFSWTPVQDDAGRITGFMSVGVETTSKMQAVERLSHEHEALVQSEMSLCQLNVDLEWQVLERSAIGSKFWHISPDLHVVVGADGIMNEANPAWTSMLGWTEHDLVGHSIFEHVHPDDLQRTFARFDDLSGGESVARFENRYLHRNGSVVWLAWSGAPLGKSFYASGRNITLEKNQSEALTALIAERDQVWQNASDVLIVADADGTLRAVNPAWRAILGHADDEVIGRNFLDFVWPDDLAFTRQALGEAQGGRAISNFVNRYRHKDGTPRVFSWNAAWNGEVGYGYGRDITRERNAQLQLDAAESALRQAQKMDAIGQLTGGIAHDFNNMLAGVSGSLEMIQRRLAKNRLDGIDRFIDMAQHSTRRAAALTQRLLAFARRQTLDPKATNVNKLVEGMVELIIRTVGPSIDVDVVVPDAVWYCKIDSSQLENALLNLCINARDAMMPKGGSIYIEVLYSSFDAVEAGARELSPGEYLTINVTDTGTGMPESVIARAFEPFFTTKPMGEGTGLGLSMVYGFVRQSGGQLQVDSRVGIGTTMRVHLPRHQGSAETVPLMLPSRDASNGGGQTILLVDDERAVRTLVTEVLKEAGYTVLTAADGQSALSILQSKEIIDLLITDVGLPGGRNGRQVADEARALRPGLQVLFITGYAENAAVGNGDLEVGMEVMTKPFELGALVLRAQDMLHNVAQLHESLKL